MFTAGLIAILLFLLLLLGWFTAVVVLLVNPKTRKTGLIILTVPMGLLVVLSVVCIALFWSLSGDIQSEHITIMSPPPDSRSETSGTSAALTPGPSPASGRGEPRSVRQDPSRLGRCPGGADGRRVSDEHHGRAVYDAAGM